MFLSSLTTQVRQKNKRCKINMTEAFTCILDSSYSFLVDGGPWLVGDEGLGSAGWDDVTMVAGPPPPNWTGGKKHQTSKVIGSVVIKVGRENWTRQMTAYLLRSLFSVPCYFLFNPLPDRNKIKSQNEIKNIVGSNCTFSNFVNAYSFAFEICHFLYFHVFLYFLSATRIMNNDNIFVWLLG